MLGLQGCSGSTTFSSVLALNPGRSWGARPTQPCSAGRGRACPHLLWASLEFCSQLIMLGPQGPLLLGVWETVCNNCFGCQEVSKDIAPVQLGASTPGHALGPMGTHSIFWSSFTLSFAFHPALIGTLFTYPSICSFIHPLILSVHPSSHLPIYPPFHMLLLMTQPGPILGCRNKESSPMLPLP